MKESMFLGPVRAGRIAALGLLMALAPLPALSDEPSSLDVASSSDTPSFADAPWEFSIAPYAWLPSIDGDFYADDTKAAVDIPFSDIFDALNAGFMLQAEARKGSWFVGGDGLWTLLHARKTSSQETVGFGPTTIQNGPISVSIPAVQTTVGPVKVKLDTNVLMLKLVGGYRVLSEPLGGDDSLRRMGLDVYAGGRFWWFQNKIGVNIPPTTIPGFQIGATVTPPRFPNRPIDLGSVTLPGLTTAGVNQTFTDTAWWIDPVIGTRFTADVTDTVGVSLLGDIGGFDIGSASKFTWELQGLLGYRMSEHWTLAVGYRAIGWDRAKQGSGFDGTWHGPIVGASYQWSSGGS